MKRIFLAAVFAVILHGLLLTVDVRRNPAVRAPVLPKTVRLTLTSISPVKVDKPQTQRAAPVCRPDPAPREPAPIEKKDSPKKPLDHLIKAPTKKLAPPKRATKPVKTPPVKMTAAPKPEPKLLSPSPAKDRGTGKRETVRARPNFPTAPAVSPPEASLEAKTEDSVHFPEKAPSAKPVEPDDSTGMGGKPARAEITRAVPAYRKNPPPRYPLIARRRGYEGTVWLKVFVDRKGTVRQVKVDRSSGHRVLDRAALKSVKNWVFVPGREGDRAADMWVSVPMRFTLQ